MAASGCYKKKTLFSDQIEAAARYCFEVLEYIPKIKIVKNDFFLDHSVAIWLKYGWNVFFNGNNIFERNIRPVMLLILFDWTLPLQDSKKFVSL